MKRNYTITTRLIAAFALAAAVGWATTMVDINLAKTVELTENAFVGKVIDVEITETALGAGERVTVEVSEGLLGGYQAGDKAIWTQYRSSERTRLPGMPQYQTGKEYLIFLSASAPNSPYKSAVGLGQGSFTVHRNKFNGETYVINEFRNRALLKDLDEAALNDAVASFEAAERAAGRSVSETPFALTHGPDGTLELSSLSRAVKAIKAVKTPSATFTKSGGTTQDWSETFE